MRQFRRCLSAITACCPFWLLMADANAADFPQRAVQINVGASPGGTTDMLSRLLAQKLTEAWGQPVVVVNKPGADHRIAAEYVAGSKADGYTMLMMVNDLTLPDPPGVKVTYDPAKSFTPVMLVATVPNCLAVRASFPAKSLQDIIGMSKAQPNKLNFSVVGTGSSAEIGIERLLVLTGIRMQFVHYQGSTPSLTALLSGEAQVNHSPCSNYLSHLQNGEIRVLAISQKVDQPPLAGVPTFEEGTGQKGYDGGGGNWYGLIGPAGIPQPVVDKIRHDVLEILAAPDVRKTLASQLIVPALALSQDDFRGLIRNDTARWAAWSKETATLGK